MANASILDLIQQQRMALAARLEALDEGQWDKASWCDGWRVRDVVAHLVHLAEATQWTMARDILGNGVRPNTSLARVAKRLGERPPTELTDRLRRAAGGRFHAPGLPAAVALGEVVVHRSDIFRALGVADEIEPEAVPPVLPVYRRIAPIAFGAKSLSKVSLEATDVDWQAGRGPTIQGPALDLVLLMANRPGAIPRLSGPGLSALHPA